MYLPEPTNDEDIAELTTAARTAAVTGRPPAPNPASVSQEQVYEVTSAIRRRRPPDRPEVRRVARSVLETALRRIGVIGRGVRVRKGDDLDELLDALVERSLTPFPPKRVDPASRSFCLACVETHWDGGNHTADGYVACDICDEEATIVREAGGHYSHLCDYCA